MTTTIAYHTTRRKIIILFTNVANRAIMLKIIEFPPLDHNARGARRKRSLLLLGVMRKMMMRLRRKSTFLLWLKAPTQVMKRIMR